MPQRNFDSLHPRSHVFFYSIEAVWAEAAVNQIVPADELGPGGVELGIVAFIDHQLAVV